MTAPDLRRLHGILSEVFELHLAPVGPLCSHRYVFIDMRQCTGHEDIKMLCVYIYVCVCVIYILRCVHAIFNSDFNQASQQMHKGGGLWKKWRKERDIFLTWKSNLSVTGLAVPAVFVCSGIVCSCGSPTFIFIHALPFKWCRWGMVHFENPRQLLPRFPWTALIFLALAVAVSCGFPCVIARWHLSSCCQVFLCLHYFLALHLLSCAQLCKMWKCKICRHHEV